MFVNIKDVDNHKKRMHGVQIPNQPIPLVRTDSDKSSRSQQSIKSPPPKKLVNEQKPEEIPLPEDIDVDQEDGQESKEETRVPPLQFGPAPTLQPGPVPPLQAASVPPLQSPQVQSLMEELRLTKIENEELKVNIALVRQVNQRQLENHTYKIKDIESGHLKAMKVFGDEYNKALNEIAKLQNENYLFKAREEVLCSTDILETEMVEAEEEEEKEEQEDECIMEVKCTGTCAHIAEENLRNLKNMRKMKQQGGRRNSPPGKC